MNVDGNGRVVKMRRATAVEIPRFNPAIGYPPRMSSGDRPRRSFSCIKAFSETDFTGDPKKIDVPTLILHGDDDQIVPVGASAMLLSKLVKGSTLKVYPGLPHGMCSTHKDQINADLLAFIKA
jgi:pimeloyl-ACP methyl ester carboxylesterase